MLSNMINRLAFFEVQIHAKGYLPPIETIYFYFMAYSFSCYILNRVPLLNLLLVVFRNRRVSPFACIIVERLPYKMPSMCSRNVAKQRQLATKYKLNEFIT